MTSRRSLKLKKYAKYKILLCRIKTKIKGIAKKISELTEKLLQDFHKLSNIKECGIKNYKVHEYILHASNGRSAGNLYRGPSHGPGHVPDFPLEFPIERFNEVTHIWKAAAERCKAFCLTKSEATTVDVHVISSDEEELCSEKLLLASYYLLYTSSPILCISMIVCNM
jgi:hypothetical protein